MNTQQDNSLIRKIQKLFNRARDDRANSSTESERLEAMALAQKLCAQHNLDIATVTDTYVEGSTVKEKREKTRINRSAMYQWQREFWKELAEMNFCFHWVTSVSESCHVLSCRCNRPEYPQKHYVKRHVLLGREANVITVKLMGEYVTDWFESNLPWPNTQRLSRPAVSWRMGAAERVIERLRVQYKTARAVPAKAGKQNTALALRSLDEWEYEANYDARYGEGAFARRQERERMWAIEDAELQRKHLEMLQNDTPAQKQEREQAEEKDRLRTEKQWQRDNLRYRRQAQRESYKIDYQAYSRGKDAADKISLQPQVKAGKPIGALA